MEIRRTEAYFRGYLDAKLYYQRWSPAGAVKGTVLITHGQGEHSDCYARVVDALVLFGWTVLAWDWRGHGRSEGARGYAEHFSDYCDDFEMWIQLLQPELQQNDKPVFMLAHSMGGLIQLKSLAAHPDWKVTAQILSNPFLGVALSVPTYKQVAAEWLSALLPKVTMSNEIPDTALSRDPQILQEYQRDSLRHDRISSRVYLGSLEAIKQVFDRADKIQIPTFLQLSSKDEVVSAGATRKFFDSLKTIKKIREYGDSKHEIYNDLDRETAFQDLRQYLGSHQ
jgi:alpha-beta hydrolase superfamily lysophospholipase